MRGSSFGLRLLQRGSQKNLAPPVQIRYYTTPVGSLLGFANPPALGPMWDLSDGSWVNETELTATERG